MNNYSPLFTELPDDRDECWSRLEQFAAFWHNISCPPVDYTRPVLQTETRLQVTLPDALIEWHMRFGRFINLWCDRAFTLPINKLKIQNGKLVIRTEMVFNGMLEAKWGIPLRDIESDDPEVVSILGDREHACANRVSHFAIFCAVFDTINSSHTRDLYVDNETPFPLGGQKMEFPDSFGIIKSEVYEGNNWLALVSGTDWYVRRKNETSGSDEYIKHELRTKGLAP